MWFEGYPDDTRCKMPTEAFYTYGSTAVVLGLVFQHLQFLGSCELMIIILFNLKSVWQLYFCEVGIKGNVFVYT